MMKTLFALCAVVCLCISSTASHGGENSMVLQQGQDNYSGASAATIGQKTVQGNGDFLYLRGSKNRMLLRFDLSEIMIKNLLEAKLRVFLPKADAQNMTTEIMCSEMRTGWSSKGSWKHAQPGKSWKSVGGDFDKRTDYRNDRPRGVVDSYELFAKPHKYWNNFRWLTQGIPEGGMWIEFDITPLVSKWLADPKSNRGVMLRPTDCMDKRFKSKWSIDIPSPSNPDKAHRPQLVIKTGKKRLQVAMIDTMTRVSDYSTNYGYRGPHDTKYTIHMAGNEFEGCQVLIKPFLKDLKNVRLVTSDLAGPKGAKIPAGEVKWYTQSFYRWRANWKTRDKFYRGKLYKNPDPLIPGEPTDLVARMHWPFWVNVHTKLGQTPGTYEGSILIKADGMKDVPIRLRVKVWPYDIPLNWNFHTMGSFGVDRIKRYHGASAKGKMHEWYEFLLDHRFAPTEQYHQVLSPRDIPFCLKRGMRPIYIDSPNDLRIKFDEKKMKQIIARYNYVKKNGWLKHAMIYIGDETKDYQKIRDRCDLIHAYCPGLMCLFGGSTPRKELIGYVDIWDPQTGGKAHYSFANDKKPEHVAETQARGERFYWYVAAGPDYPYMNVQLEDPLIGSRLFMWLSWKYGVTGFEYYCYNIWGNPANSKGKNGKKFPDVPWVADGWKRGWASNCDGLLYYPGRNGSLASSLRFENLRDGIEDWESCYVLRDYLDALKKKGGNRDLVASGQKALDIPSDLVKDMVSYTLDPKMVYKQRRAVGDAIAAISKAVKRKEYEAVRNARIAAVEKKEAKMLAKRHKEALKRLNLTKADVKKWQTEAGVHKP